MLRLCEFPGCEGRKSQGALARLCEFPMPEATIEIPVQMERVSAMIAETLLILCRNQNWRLRLLSDSCLWRFAHGLRWGFHPHAPDKGLRPLTLFRFAQF